MVNLPNAGSCLVDGQVYIDIATNTTLGTYAKGSAANLHWSLSALIPSGVFLVCGKVDSTSHTLSGCLINRLDLVYSGMSLVLAKVLCAKQ